MNQKNNYKPILFAHLSQWDRLGSIARYESNAGKIWHRRAKVFLDGQ